MHIHIYVYTYICIYLCAYTTRRGRLSRKRRRSGRALALSRAAVPFWASVHKQKQKVWLIRKDVGWIYVVVKGLRPITPHSQMTSFLASFLHHFFDRFLDGFLMDFGSIFGLFFNDFCISFWDDFLIDFWYFSKWRFFVFQCADFVKIIVFPKEKRRFYNFTELWKN